MKADFLLNKPNIVYDIRYELDDQAKGDGIFLITFLNILFNLKIEFTKAEGVVKSSIEYLTVNSGGRGQYSTEIKIYPKTPYFEAIAREVCTIFSI